MRFSIITPTYKRPEKLTRAVDSVRKQTYSDWEMIIVNDSPSDQSYTSFASSINDPRIHYHVNQSNMGVNFSRNVGLEKVSADSKWIIFLDDDDYLAPDALTTFRELIENHPHLNWFVTNRALKDGTSITHAPRSNKRYSYIFDYLLLKRFRGDATHAINTNLLATLRFSKNIQQGEEWVFFYQLGLGEHMFYHDHNSTITDGYESSGLNFRKRELWDYLYDMIALFSEGVERRIWYRPTFLFYMLLRLIKRLLQSVLHFTWKW